MTGTRKNREQSNETTCGSAGRDRQQSGIQVKERERASGREKKNGGGKITKQEDWGGKINMAESLFGINPRACARFRFSLGEQGFVNKNHYSHLILPLALHPALPPPMSTPHHRLSHSSPEWRRVCVFYTDATSHGTLAKPSPEVSVYLALPACLRAPYPGTFTWSIRILNQKGGCLDFAQVFWFEMTFLLPCQGSPNSHHWLLCVRFCSTSYGCGRGITLKSVIDF